MGQLVRWVDCHTKALLTDQPTNQLTQPLIDKHCSLSLILFSRGHATLHLAMSVGRLVGRSVTIFFKFRAIIALWPLPNRPRLFCRVSDLVFLFSHVPRNSTPGWGKRSLRSQKPMLFYKLPPFMIIIRFAKFHDHLTCP